MAGPLTGTDPRAVSESVPESEFESAGGPEAPGEARGLRLAERGSFPKSARVLQRRDFDKIHQRGIRVHAPDFTVVACRSVAPDGDSARFGCAVSRKVGPAVVRNRLKRLMREVFRRCRSDLPKVDLVVILRPSAASSARGHLDDMASMLLPAFERAARQAMDASSRKGGRKKGRRKRTSPQSNNDPKR